MIYADRQFKSMELFFKNSYLPYYKKIYSQTLVMTQCPECDHNTRNYEPVMVYLYLYIGDAIV